MASSPRKNSSPHYNADHAYGPLAESLGIGIFANQQQNQNQTQQHHPHHETSDLSDQHALNASQNNPHHRRQSFHRSGTFHRPTNAIKRFGSMRLASSSFAKAARPNTNEINSEPAIVRNMRKWRAAIHVVRASLRLVIMSQEGLKKSERQVVSESYWKYISKSSKSQDDSSKSNNTKSGPIDSESKLVNFLRTELGFVGVIEEEERNCGCDGITIHDLLQYHIEKWPIRINVLCTVIAQLTKRDEWQQQLLASKNASAAFSQVPLGRLLFQQLAVDVPRDEAKSMARKRKHEELNGNEQFGKEHPVLLPTSSDDDSTSDDEDIKYGVFNDDDDGDSDYHDGTANGVFTEKWGKINNKNSNNNKNIRKKPHQSSTMLTPTPPPQKKKRTTRTATVKRVDARTFVEVLERFHFPEEVTDLFRQRASSHPWLSQKAIETILEDPLQNAASVAKLSALTQSVSFSSIQAKRAKDRIQEASAQLVSAMWKKLSGGGGTGGSSSDHHHSLASSTIIANASFRKMNKSYVALESHQQQEASASSQNNNMMASTSFLQPNNNSSTTNHQVDLLSASSAISPSRQRGARSAPEDSVGVPTSPLSATQNNNSSSEGFSKAATHVTAEGLFSSTRHRPNMNDNHNGEDYDNDNDQNENNNVMDQYNTNTHNSNNEALSGQAASVSHLHSATRKYRFREKAVPKKEETFFQKYFRRNNNSPIQQLTNDESHHHNTNGTVNGNSDVNHHHQTVHQEAEEMDRDSWKKKMTTIFGDARPHQKKTMAEFRFVELATPRRHQQQFKTELATTSETVGFTTSEQRWWLRGVSNQTPESGRVSPSQYQTTRRQIFGQQQHYFSNSTARGGRGSRPVSAAGGGHHHHHQSATAGSDRPSSARKVSSPTTSRPTSGASSRRSNSKRRRNNNNNNNNNASPSSSSAANLPKIHHHHSNNSDQNQPQPWHVSSARVEGAPNPPLPLPGTPRRERDREGKKLPPPRPKWSKINPFVEGKSWDDV